jgi:prepilin-type N-terminal cleavage/methylation domain-containing protein
VRARGFSLPELLISLVLFSLIVASLLSIVLGAGRSQAYSARIDVAQSGVRQALEFMTRDIIMASSGASSGNIVDGASGVAVLAVNVIDSTSGPDTLDLVLADPTAMANVTVGVTTGATTISTNIPTAPAPPTFTFKANDRIMISDLATATLTNIVSATQAAPNGTLTLPALAHLANGIASYPPGSYVFRAKQVRYSVDSTTLAASGVNAALNTIPLLMYDPDGATGPQAAQPLAEGVEDFQVALGFDNNGDGLITENGLAANDDEWVFNVAGEAMPATLANLRAVRVSLVVRTTSAALDSGAHGQRPRAEDHAAAAAPDQFPRRVIRSEIAVRNFNL